jgi:hypothetical protein
LIRKTFAAGLAALSLGVAAAPAAAWHTAGGITFDANEPYKYGSIQADSFASWTATANGTYTTTLQHYSPSGWLDYASKSTMLIQGVTYNFWQKASSVCSASLWTYRVKVTFRGVSDFSASRAITCP